MRILIFVVIDKEYNVPHIGPFVSALVNAFGIRATAIAGAIICSVSSALSTLANSITVLPITYGFLGGME